MEYVEVRGKTVEVAIDAAMRELGVESRERIEVEVVQEPERGFLGFGGQDAVIRVTLKPEQRKRRRRRRKRGPGEGQAESGEKKPQQQQESRQREQRPQKQRQQKGGPGGQRGASGEQQSRPRQGNGGKPKERTPERREEKTVAIEEQVPVVEEFLSGLVESFGLEGDVEVRAEDEIIIANVSGPQTGAMVGPRGSVIEAVHELTKTVLHRRTEASSRLRLDIAGYAERRRQALAIYAGQLIDQVLDEGGEVMLEPMSAADRKVIHDSVAEREGVRSYSEGESPQRYVVIAAEQGADEERSQEEE